MRRKLVAGNWKMNGDSAFAKAFGEELAKRVAGGALECGVMIAPPAALLPVLKSALSGSPVDLAAQNVSEYEAGAYTGETAASLISDLGCKASLVGHSERRTLFHESDAQVAEKIKRLLEQRVVPVLCVGETLQEREAGQAQEIVTRQVQSALTAGSVDQLANMIIAYEPVWAIGTGLTASPVQAQEMHAHIRAELARVDESLAANATILYGGSVNSKTAPELFAQPDIDGGLVGGASLKVDEFFTICQSF